jgi:membrane protein implicated in regulation of membrane protease activity
MTPHMKWGIAGIILGLILIIALPTSLLLLGVAVIVLALAVPIVAWRMLDESQRRRFREVRRRRQIR